MRLTFCGVRGSSPASGEAFRRTGGHTSCVAVAHDGQVPSLVLDAGSGIRSVTALLGSADFHGAVVLGHVHWDHVMGLPFFAAADREGADTELYVPEQGMTAQALLSQVMRPPFFPIGPGELRGGWTFATYGEGSFVAGGFTVTAREIPHKGGRTMGLRVEDGTHAVAYLSDHAPQVLGAGPDGIGEYHEAALSLAAGVDLLVHDSQYTAAELPRRGAFGHAAAEHSVRLAELAGAGRVLLYHHDPVRTDDELDAIVASCRAGARSSVRIDAATEGLVVDL